MHPSTPRPAISRRKLAAVALLFAALAVAAAAIGVAAGTILAAHTDTDAAALTVHPAAQPGVRPAPSDSGWREVGAAAGTIGVKAARR